MDESPWKAPVDIADVPDSGLHVELEAPAPVRNALAELAGLRALPRLAATFDVTRRGAGLHVSGEVTAQVGQTCVVTLEPLDNEVEEPVDLLFLPGVPEPKAEGRAETEEEPPEPLIDGRIDLGAIATEFLVLGIDPYPRKPGATFSPPQSETNGVHPFAALAALKNKPRGSRS